MIALVLCPGRFNDPDPHRERRFQLERDWLELLESQTVNHTLAWRSLADAAKGHEQPFNLWYLKHVPRGGRFLFSGDFEMG